MLSAGERRAYTANDIFRDPTWRKRDANGALRVSLEDAEALSLVDGGRARITTAAGSAEASVEISEAMLPGHASLPNGFGLDFVDGDGHPHVPGVAPNSLTSTGPTRARSAEQWARAILEDAPVNVRLRLLSAWSAIGLKVSLAASDRVVLGWDIRVCDGDFILLGADSRIGMPGELLLRREQHGLLFATFVRHDNAGARALWATIETAHVRTVSSLLEQASRRVVG